MEGKLIIFAAPSGSGKSTIINSIMADGGDEELNLHFSVSATSRAPRGEEQNGVEYFFLSPEEFKAKIANDEFVEYEEVYKDKFYGTLKSQVDKQLAAGENIVFDVDVNGALRIKRLYGKRALSIFIQPPSIEELRSRLEKRATDAPEVIEQRIERAKYELSQAENFDEVIINDNLEIAQVEARALVEDFLSE
ncbi:MAG: guanylate kinase [Bacteroidaceae bacterium]|nr:guanylate kinase [Bacteroidaceae bacterium]MCI6802401.1 guanylate kinase [Prevotellaceae bacterium]MBS7322386.1 guanylate kinase [Bacteroidaceae bacterium]MDD6014693.1 guanylate kinase [Prevotellaceae bacterium]MDD7527321.1 guanylate kinase [Prevotellaceae bacterium]